MGPNGADPLPRVPFGVGCPQANGRGEASADRRKIADPQMRFQILSPETAALVLSGTLAPSVALQAGETMTINQRRALWARHNARQREAAATMAQLRRDWLNRNR